MLRPLSALLALSLFCSPVPAATAQADPGTFAIRGAHVIPVVGPELPSGTVLVQNGRIVAVGAEVEIPEGVPVLEAEGRVLIPGLVDTHSHVGIYPRPAAPAHADGNEGSGAVQPALRAIDAIHPADPAIRMATAGGVTTANIMPGSGNVVGGQTAYVKLRGRTIEDMAIDLGARAGGMKMANGENPKRVYGPRDEAPMTRMKVAALQRELFQRAKAYRERWARHREKLAAGEESTAPERDLGLEAVVDVLERRRTVHFHTHRADDVMTAMRLAEEFGFELVLQHVTEAALVAGEIARRGHPVSLILVESPGGKHEARRLSWSTPAALEAAGARVALHTDDPITHSRQFLRAGALAVHGGMSREGALRALTIEGARMLHLEDRIGSIERGKHADLVLLSGDPFSVYTRVLATWIEGEKVFDRARPEHLRYATGGYAVAARLPARDRAQVAPQVVLERRDVERPAEPGARFAVEAEWLFTGVGPPISRGVVLVEGGRVEVVGAQGEVDVPQGTPLFRAPAVTPGIVDAHATAGLSGVYNVAADQDANEVSAPNQAGLRALDGFNPDDALVGYLLSRGVTVLQAVPGPGAPIAGQAGVFRTFGQSARTMALRPVSAVVFDLGERPKAVFGARRAAPMTRMATAALIRAALLEARAWAAEPEAEREPSLEKAALARVLAQELPALFVAHRADDLLTALRIAREFDLRCMLSQATEGYLVAEEIARAGAPVLVGPLLARASALELDNACYENAALLRDAGVPIAITSGYEAYVPKTHVAPLEAAVAAVNGLGVVPALRAVTIDAARLLGIEAERGSLERGKAADLVLWDGDPLETVTRVEVVIGDGRVVYDRAAP